MRYVAEYVDEGYLKLLDEFNKANDSTYVNCGNFEQIFMPQTYRISNAQLMTMLSFDANASAKRHSAAAEERQQEFSNAVQQWHEYMMDDSFNDVDEAFNDAIDQMVADAFAEEDKDGKEAKPARRARPRVVLPARPAVPLPPATARVMMLATTRPRSLLPSSMLRSAGRRRC